MKMKSICLCVFYLLTTKQLFSQIDTISKKKQDDSTRLSQSLGKDVIDVLHLKRLADDGVPMGKHSTKARITVVPFVGYTLQTRVAGIIAGNIAFYTDEEELTNQSAIVISVSYSQNKQVIFPILSNIWTKKNKYNLLGNWRYYKYPEQTYGLGGNTSPKNRTKLDYSYFIFREAVLRHISGSDVYVGPGYNLSYHTDISQEPSSKGELTDFEKYGLNKKSISSGLSAHALFDNRGNTINPQKGTYVNLAYYRFIKLLGGDNDWQSVIIDMRKYFSLGRAKNVLALWSYNWFTFAGKAPYLDLPSTGWDAYGNVGRGYIQSRLRGQNLLYLEAEYRFKITHNGLFGGVLFANAQSVTDWPSNQFRTLHPAAGLGFRFKLNKFSGTNLSIDYGFGVDGSKGLFINIGEVF
jgi:outer membrane protein assembly factor BamA